MEQFREPPWDAPLDVAAELKRVPDSLTQKGMFLLAISSEAKKRGFPLKSARDRYVPFHDYPLREHATLLVEAAHAFYPDMSLRQGLRRLGRAALPAFMESTVGKVVFAGVADSHAAFEAMVKGYAIGVPGCTARLLDRKPNSALIRLERVPYFLDSHHVGCFEGATRAIGIRAHITIRMEGWSAGEFLCEW